MAEPASTAAPTPAPIIDTFVLGDFQTNCHIVTTPGDDECWIVDCGYDPEQMLDAIAARGLRPIAILLTHAHADHIAGVDAALSRFGDIPMYLHRAERDWCSTPMLNLSGLMGAGITCRRATDLLAGGETLELNGTSWEVIHAPGHSPGSVLYVHRPSKQAIVGDTLFAGSIGRIDLPTSDPEAMQHTIQDIMLGFPDDLTILPGHGPNSTIGRERRTNPFILQGI
jgi:glyoxylase-like metal-dependent hydrolase (beta-lactamase superfamily II)